MASNTSMKQPISLKDHKKAQKEKSAAKRAAAAAAAAQQSKSRKVTKANVKNEPDVNTDVIEVDTAEQKTIMPIEMTAEKQLLEDIVYATTVVNAQDDASAMPIIKHDSGDYLSTMQGFHSHTYTNLGVHAHTDLVVPSEKKTEDVTPAVTTDAPSSHAVNSAGIAQESSDLQPATEVSDIHAERKAIEAALYDSMESPKKMWARICKVASASAEYHHNMDELDEELEPETSASILRAIDSIGFELVIARVDLSADTSSTQILSVGDLFRMVSSSGASSAGSSDSEICQTLEMVEEQHYKAIEHASNVGFKEDDRQISNTAFTDPAIISCKVKPSHNMEEVVRSFIDPAIITLKLKPQPAAPQNHHDIPYYLPATTLQAASAKLAALLNIDGQVPHVGSRSRNTSYSTNESTGFQTPLTRHSSSPPLVWEK
jgi:hypothetical protein